jgi:glutamyl-tRNA synthetase
MSEPEIVRTRFAPSPSGHLHVGGARTALFCWAYARQHGGKFILRIEDTDRKRSSDAASMAFLEDLEWLGLNWDEGPFLQSDRLTLYTEHLDRLIADRKAYPAFDTPEELAAKRAEAQKSGEPYRYDRASLMLDTETVKEYIADVRPRVVRLFVDEDMVPSVTVHDEVFGDVETPGAQLDDFIIRKADGWPTYHFAVVVDDQEMGVTHVLRAQEHLTNTAKHVILQDALGFKRPKYAHLSVISNPDGSKMSKRDKDKALRAAVRDRKIETPPEGAVAPDRWSWWLEKKDHQLDLDEAERLAKALDVTLPEINVDDFRRAGYLPGVLLNYLALLGWSPGGDVEKFDLDFIVENFSLDRVIKSAAKFDRDKLLAFNHDALQELTPDEFARLFREHCQAYHAEFLEKLTDEQFDMLARANQTRSKTLGSVVPSCRFFISDDDSITYEDTKPVRKALVKGETPGYDHLDAVLPVLEGLDEWTVPALEAALTAWATEHTDGQLGKIAQPLRVAVSGTTVSPAIFETLVILGKPAVLARIRRCLSNRLDCPA